MSKTTAARTALRTAVASAMIVLVTGVGAQAGWADEPTGTTTVAPYENGNGGTAGTGTGTTGTAATTDNNPWD